MLHEIVIRRSIRKYQDKPVEAEKLEQLVRAAMQAPSAGNQRPWEFIVVDDKDLLAKLAGMSPFAKPVAQAAAAVVMLANRKKLMFPENWQMDMGAATENLLLEAVHQGLGAVWMAIAPLEDRVSYIRQLFNLPPDITPYALVPIGYPAQENTFVDRYESNRVHHNKY